MKKIFYWMVISILIFCFVLSREVKAKEEIISSKIESPLFIITLQDFTKQPLDNVRVYAYAPEVSEPVAERVTDMFGTAWFSGLTLPHGECYFVALLDAVGEKKESIGKHIGYDSRAYGSGEITQYFITMPVSVPEGEHAYKQTYVINPMRYVDFIDFGSMRADFFLEQEDRKVKVHFAAASNDETVRIYMPMKYLYTVQATYSGIYAIRQRFLATPGLRIVLS